MYGDDYPELPASESLVDYWRDIGFASPAPMGGAFPISWRDVQAFKEAGGYDISPCEARCLVDMSRAYVQGMLDDHPLSIAPMERDYD